MVRCLPAVCVPSCPCARCLGAVPTGTIFQELVPSQPGPHLVDGEATGRVAVCGEGVR